LVDIKPGLDVVNSVHHEVETLPELVVEDGLGVRAHAGLVVLHVELPVDVLGDLAGDLGLGVADVVLAEEELAVEVGHLDVVVVSD
jgi:hypothetical protein